MYVFFAQNICRKEIYILPLQRKQETNNILILKIMNKKQTSVMLALATIAANNKDGFTVNAATLRPITTGYAVAVAATQNSFGIEGLANVVKYVAAHPEVNAFGGWYNKINKHFYFDATVIVDDLAAAKELGRVNKQIAIFDLANLKEIRL